MNKKFLLLGCFILLTLIGCEMLDKASEQVNKNIDTIELIKKTAPAVHPYGWFLSAGLSLALIVTKLYDENKKRNLGNTLMVIKGKSQLMQQDKDEIQLVLKSIIESIEAVKNTDVTEDKTIGDIVKNTVKSKLKNNGIYNIGKEIIKGLQNESS